MHRAKRARTRSSPEEQDEFADQSDGSEYEEKDRRKRGHSRRRRRRRGSSNNNNISISGSSSSNPGRVTRAMSRAADPTSRRRTDTGQDQDLSPDQSLAREHHDDEDEEEELGKAATRRRRQLTVFDTVAVGRRSVGIRTAQMLAMKDADTGMGRRVYRNLHAMPTADEVLGNWAARVHSADEDENENERDRDRDRDASDAHRQLAADYAAIAGLHVPPSVSILFISSSQKMCGFAG
ncbi:hypothetical protein V1509DRAFT_634988 [Lipomyces kononenkoae]